MERDQILLFSRTLPLCSVKCRATKSVPYMHLTGEREAGRRDAASGKADQRHCRVGCALVS